jgi:hypothetical protein
MTAVKEHQLPARAFGLPAERKYPMPDPAHAKNAKARATQQFKKGNLTARERDQIHRKADRVIDACAKPKRKTKGLGRGKSWTPAQARQYKREAAACSRRKKCSTKRGKKKMSCERGCKSAASRTVGK